MPLYAVADQFGDGVRNHLGGQVNTIVIAPHLCTCSSFSITQNLCHVVELQVCLVLSTVLATVWGDINCILSGWEARATATPHQYRYLGRDH